MRCKTNSFITQTLTNLSLRAFGPECNDPGAPSRSGRESARTPRDPGFLPGKSEINNRHFSRKSADPAIAGTLAVNQRTEGRNRKIRREWSMALGLYWFPDNISWRNALPTRFSCSVIQFLLRALEERAPCRIRNGTSNIEITVYIAYYGWFRV